MQRFAIAVVILILIILFAVSRKRRKVFKCPEDYFKSLSNPNRPGLIFINGAGCAGKTEVARRMTNPSEFATRSKFNYHVVHLDDVIDRHIARGDNNSNPMYHLYRPGEYPNEKARLIEIVLNEIHGRPYVVLEGAIQDPAMMAALARGRPYQSVIVEPANEATYRRNIVARFNRDVKRNWRTRGFIWDNMPKSAFCDGQIGPGFTCAMEAIARTQFEKIKKVRDLFDGRDYAIVKN